MDPMGRCGMPDCTCEYRVFRVGDGRLGDRKLGQPDRVDGAFVGQSQIVEGSGVIAHGELAGGNVDPCEG